MIDFKITQSPIFPIGTQYIPYYTKKDKSLRTVKDYRFTFNSKGEQTQLRYVCSHEFLGQEVFEYDVCEISIQRSLQK